MACNDHTQGYGKLKHHTEENESIDKQDSNRKKLLVTITISSILLFSLIMVLVVPPVTNNATGARTSRSDSVAAICNITHYPFACSNAISSLLSKNATRAPDPEQILTIFLRSSITHLTNLSFLLKPVKNNSNSTSAMNDCVDEFKDAIDLLEKALFAVEVSKDEEKRSGKKTMGDVQSWVSAAMTCQDTCSDGMNEVGLKEFGGAAVRLEMSRSKEALSISLTITANMEKIMELLR